MKKITSAAFGTVLLSALSFGQATFVVTGTAIPADLLQQNYGKLPKSLIGYDLSVCNTSQTKQSIVSSEIYQAMSESNEALHPIGRQIMLAVILRNQNHGAMNILGLVLNSVTGVLSVLSSSKTGVPAGVGTAAALGSLSAQQLITSLKPVLSDDQIEKFETQVLEPALVLDAGSCVERTVFAAVIDPKSKTEPLSFHVR